MSDRKRLLTIIFAFFFSGITMTLGTFDNSRASDTSKSGIQNDKKITVSTVPVFKQAVTRRFRAPGRLQEEIHHLFFKIPGNMVSIRADEGQAVKKGQILAQLDQKEAVYQLDYEKTKLEKSKRHHRRISELHEAKVVSPDEYADAVTELNLNKTLVRTAELRVGYSTLRAPGKGVIIKRYFDFPTAVSAGMPVFSFKDYKDPWVVTVRLSDELIGWINQGDSATLFFPAFPMENFKGNISTIGQAADPIDGLFEVKISFSAQNRLLKPGMYAEAEIVHVDPNQRYHVPITALSNMQGMAGRVFGLGPGSDRAVAVPVTVLFFDGPDAVVDADLIGFDRIITQGRQNVTEGERVRIVHSESNN